MFVSNIYAQYQPKMYQNSLRSQIVRENSRKMCNFQVIWENFSLWVGKTRGKFPFFFREDLLYTFILIKCEILVRGAPTSDLIWILWDAFIELKFNFKFYNFSSLSFFYQKAKIQSYLQIISEWRRLVLILFS